MAEFDKYSPSLLKVECLWKNGFPKYWESIESLFELSRPGAYVNNPNDKGGPTFAGITLGTYRQFYGMNMSVQNLKNMAYHEWKTIYKAGYWDILQADKIINQSIADICTDWTINSGTKVIRNIQGILGVRTDGIIGPKTLAAINGYDCPMCLFNKIKEARKKYYEDIVAKNPSQRVFLKGWLNRLNMFDFKTE